MADRTLSDALFRPRSVALVGASGDEKKNTARPQRYLRKHGFKGKIVPINPGRDEVLGERAYPDIASVPEPVDHAFIMIPGAAVPAAIEDCAKAGVKIATIFSDGFAETGDEGRARQQAIVAAAREAGVRIVGPNSMGVIDVHVGAAITVNAVLEMPELKPGPLGVVSQSGTMIGTLLSRGAERSAGFSKLVSIGNEADLTVGEVGDMLVDDPDTGAILLFIESIRDPVALAAMARRAYAAGKPVIAYKLGRSQAGRAIAISHSGAIAGDDEAAGAFLKHHGILRVDILETLIEIAPLVMGRRPPNISGGGKNVAVLTTTGGGAATVVDRLGAEGMTPVTAPQSVRAVVEPMGIALGHGPLVDVTMAGTRREVYEPTLEALIAAPEVDAVVAVVGSSAQFHPQIAVEPIVAAAKKSTKPLAAFLVPRADESLRLLAEAGIAGFRTPEACADAMRACLEWSAPKEPPPAPAKETLAAATEALGRAETPILDEWASRAVFDALGIPQAPARLLSGDEVHSVVGYPAVAKIVSPDIAHKSDAGGVVLNITDDLALADAVAKIRGRVSAAHPDARISGVLVQRMESGVGEALIGYRMTAETGPIVTLASGGTLAEIYKDAAIRLAPVDLETARAMVQEVKGLAPIRGYRGHKKGDLEALARAIVALSALACLPPDAPRVMEAEINPLIVKEDGVVAVDGLVVLARKD